jgi:hypothetical protein
MPCSSLATAFRSGASVPILHAVSQAVWLGNVL